MEMGKEEMERTRTGHVEGGASIMGRGKGKKQNRAGHVDWSEKRRIGGFIIFLLDRCQQDKQQAVRVLFVYKIEIEIEKRYRLKNETEIAW